MSLSKDIQYLDGRLREVNSNTTSGLGDHAQHAVRYIDEALKLLLFTETKEMELISLDSSLSRVHDYMLKSAGAKLKYGEIFPLIESAKDSVSPAYKKNALRNIQTILGH